MALQANVDSLCYVLGLMRAFERVQSGVGAADDTHLRPGARLNSG